MIIIRRTLRLLWLLLLLRRLDEQLNFIGNIVERKKDVVMGSDSTKEIIIEATMELAKHQVGALMTIEKHNTLEPYAEKSGHTQFKYQQGTIA